MWLKDPVTKIESVSLTVAVVFSVILAAVGLAQVLGKVTTLGPFVEMFYSGWALYYGRRIKVAGKLFSSSKAEEVTKKVSSA